MVFWTCLTCFTWQRSIQTWFMTDNVRGQLKLICLCLSLNGTMAGWHNKHWLAFEVFRVNTGTWNLCADQVHNLCVPHFLHEPSFCGSIPAERPVRCCVILHWGSIWDRVQAPNKPIRHRELVPWDGGVAASLACPAPSSLWRDASGIGILLAVAEDMLERMEKTYQPPDARLGPLSGLRRGVIGSTSAGIADLASLNEEVDFQYPCKWLPDGTGDCKSYDTSFKPVLYPFRFQVAFPLLASVLSGGVAAALCPGASSPYGVKTWLFPD